MALNRFMREKLILTFNEVAELFFKFLSNQLPLFAIGFGPIGYGIFLGINTTTIKHSCSKNASQIFNGKEMTLTAIDKIENFSDVRMAYTANYHETTESRRKYLAERYFFTCHCSLCDDEKFRLMESSMKCQECNGGCVPIANMVCLDCNCKASPEMLQKYQEIKAKLILPETLICQRRTSKPEPVFEDLKLYEHFFEEASGIFHPLDCTFYKLREMAKFSICGSFVVAICDSGLDFGTVSEATLVLLLRIAQSSVIACRTRLAPFHTDLALNEYDVAFLNAYLGKIDEADEAFKRYEDIMIGCFGEREDLPLSFMECKLRKANFESAKKKEDFLVALFEKLTTKVSGQEKN